MKIMLLALHFAEYACLLAAALRMNAEVMLVVYEDNATNELGGDFRNLIAGMGITLEVLQRPRSMRDVLSNAGRLRKLVRQFDPAVLHIQEDGRDETVLALIGLGRLPVILTVHDPVPHSGHDAQRYRYSRTRLYHTLLRRRADGAITHGKALQQDLTTAMPRFKDRTFVIAHGPLGVLKQSPRARRQPGTPAQLLFFGRIHAYKGLRYFVEAVIALHEQGHQVLGVVAGRGTDLEQYRETMQKAGCFDIRDRYIDAEEVVDVFNKTDVVVLPYTDATQSGVAAMALGYGIPVVATAVGSIPEFVRDDVNGRLVPPRDSAALACAVQQVIASPGEYEKLSQNAVLLRDGDLSWRQIAEKALRCYDETLQRRYQQRAAG